MTRNKRAAFTVLLVLLVSSPGLAAGFFYWKWQRSRVRWDAEILMRTLDCSGPGICRKQAGTVLEEHDAAGRPYRVRTNALGFRGADLPPVRADASTLRVAMFGDSHVYGIGVEDDETLPAALEAELRRRFPGRPVEVLNFGLPMNFLPSNLVTYREFARPFSPDAVVFPWNGWGSACPYDLNHRLREIRESRFIGGLMKHAPGRWAVNYFQNARLEGCPSEDERAPVVELFGQVTEDARRSGLIVAMFSMFDDFGGLELVPAAATAIRIPSGMGLDEYVRRGFALPGDGHATPEGNRHFAKLVADALEPPLRTKVGRGAIAAP